MHALEKEVSSDVDAASANADPWGVAGAIEAFNVLEYCVRYTDRLSKEIYAAVSYHCICSLFRASSFRVYKNSKIYAMLLINIRARRSLKRARMRTVAELRRPAEVPRAEERRHRMPNPSIFPRQKWTSSDCAKKISMRQRWLLTA